ncbi:hypothetical protein Msil_2771 [Methylocella silvestris BL2]|uniref:Ribbon-helix-helix protein CopG domain-containing protein n=1 Tax=Methylocella silvestris (strain DSM 15510 / CIP 108128 / LMG 27833 / NCIMB 13906 / BL2) TaxID=395965 RepID=B8ERZ3_METSB|nr:hypothetical protein [Methylocella silvestris]ACK51691.1 hypothetical protein Msil_2771 [Methylocella silvestris BL2]
MAIDPQHIILASFRISAPRGSRVKIARAAEEFGMSAAEFVRLAMVEKLAIAGGPDGASARDKAS